MKAKEFFTEDKAGTIISLTNLSINSHVKNAFLNDVYTEVENCYNDDLTIDKDKAIKFVEYISKYIGGIIEPSDDMNTSSYAVQQVCKLIREL